MSVTPRRRRAPSLGFSADPERSATLPAHYYHDAGIFAREREAIFFRSWQFVGFAHDLRAPGDYLTAEIIDQNVFVVRTGEGTLRAFHNVCMHRGHVLLEGCGNVGTIACPFHGWRYDFDGNLEAAGNAENVARFEHADFGLSEVRVEAFARMVFVNFAADAVPLATAAADLADDIRASVPGFDKLAFVRSDPFSIRANWKFVFDGLECYHCPFLHPDLMGRSDSPFEMSFEATEREIWSKHLNRSNPEVTAGDPGKRPWDYGAEDAIRDTHIWYLWPNLMMAAHPGASNFKARHVMPLAPDFSRQHIHHLSINDPPTAADLANFDYIRDVLDPQDIAAMEQQQLGVRSRGYSQGRLMVDGARSWRSEHGTHHFDDMVWRALNGARYES
ncbi:MAG: aromatic ring-hydroxylating dioxygenase subunit alpha [Alphaproteobacteria bacterium]|nr:aromatic ring-hydroxylating dioxygenase subunit alpha [Alphaproteobacteria bacterium]